METLIVTYRPNTLNNRFYAFQNVQSIDPINLEQLHRSFERKGRHILKVKTFSNDESLFSAPFQKAEKLRNDLIESPKETMQPLKPFIAENAVSSVDETELPLWRHRRR